MASEPGTQPYPTVLIADDELVIRKMLSAALQQQGYAVLLAANGGEALRLAFDEAITVILLDYQMPGLSGESFCRQYRTGGGRAPIVLLTGIVGSRLNELTRRCQPDAVLVKPFRLSELYQIIQRLLDATP